MLADVSTATMMSSQAWLIVHGQGVSTTGAGGGCVAQLKSVNTSYMSFKVGSGRLVLWLGVRVNFSHHHRKCSHSMLSHQYNLKRWHRVPVPAQGPSAGCWTRKIPALYRPQIFRNLQSRLRRCLPRHVRNASGGLGRHNMGDVRFPFKFPFRVIGK